MHRGAGMAMSEGCSAEDVFIVFMFQATPIG